jgi:hypothetical protein
MQPMNTNDGMSAAGAHPPPPSWHASGADQTQLFNLDPSLELLGLNLNELWGESWELG